MSHLWDSQYRAQRGYSCGTSLAFLFLLEPFNERRKVMRGISNLFLSVFLAANLAACSTQRTVTRDVEYDQRTGEPVRVERETTTTTSTSTEDTGILSGTVNVIGEVISLPFRAVGGLIRAIF
jgi:hypothetical protein